MKLPKFFGIELFDNSDWKKDVLIGVGLGILFILANQISPSISIGIPSVPLGVTETNQNLIIGGIAPILEEIGFRGVLMGALLIMGLSFGLAALLQAGAFMIFHLVAYGASLSASGAFLGAFVFGIAMVYLVRWRNNLLPAIIVHSIFNIYLLTKALVFVAF